MGAASYGLKKLFNKLSQYNNKPDIMKEAKRLKGLKSTNNAEVDDAAREAIAVARAKQGTEKAPAPGLAAERAKNRANKRDAKLTPKVNARTRGTVSAEDIKQADTVAKFREMQARLEKMPEGNRKKMMTALYQRQLKAFEAKQAAEVDKAGRKSSQANRDRKEFKGYTPTSPFSKGGMAAKRKAYNKGGYVNCGASNPATQKGKK
jgi:hypothetical protein